jgi:hypothetical protein
VRSGARLFEREGNDVTNHTISLFVFISAQVESEVMRENIFSQILNKIEEASPKKNIPLHFLLRLICLKMSMNLDV